MVQPGKARQGDTTPENEHCRQWSFNKVKTVKWPCSRHCPASNGKVGAYMGISDCEGQRLLRDRKSEPVGPPRPDKVSTLATVWATTELGKWLIQEMSRVDILGLAAGNLAPNCLSSKDPSSCPISGPSWVKSDKRGALPKSEIESTTGVSASGRRVCLAP